MTRSFKNDFLLSIVIVNWNTKELLRNCLRSIIESLKEEIFEVFGKKVEIIVVDNGSSDGSVAYLESFFKRIRNKFQLLELKLIKNKKNLGFAKANNQGIKNAFGKHILLLNTDTLIGNNKGIRKLIEFAEVSKDAGVIAPCLLNKDGTIQPSCFHFPSLSGVFGEFFLGKKGLFSKYFPEGKGPQVVDAVVGAAFLITARALEKVGFLDERYFFYYEDLDYCRRTKNAGLKVYYLPLVKIYHFHGYSSRKIKGGANKLLVESAKIYHGFLGFYFINFFIWLGQKWQRLKRFF